MNGNEIGKYHGIQTDNEQDIKHLLSIEVKHLADLYWYQVNSVTSVLYKFGYSQTLNDFFFNFIIIINITFLHTLASS